MAGIACAACERGSLYCKDGGHTCPECATETVVLDGAIREEYVECGDGLLLNYLIGAQEVGQVLAEHVGKVAHVTITLREPPYVPPPPTRHWWYDREIPDDAPEEDLP